MPASADKETEFPRVLIVYHMCLNKADQHGLSLRSWFADWPREKLAQIYSGGEVGTERFCGRSFRLGRGERRWGRLFFSLKGGVGEAGLPVVSCSEPGNTRPTLASRLKGWVARGILHSGLWEFLFRPVLSPELEEWVEEFAPQIIYCQGYSLSFAWLPLLLHRRFETPLCFQTGDDWPMNLYRNTPFSRLVRPRVEKAAAELISCAAARFANGREMVDEYTARYGVDFAPLMMCDERKRFTSSIPRRLVGDEQVSIVYSGSLGSGRCRPLADLCRAVTELGDRGNRFRVIALATAISPEGRAELECFENLRILPAPAHEDLPSLLKGGDILFLPEAFEHGQAQSIELSISTKAHLYMMSERPILVYGPPQSGSVKYAKEGKWACVVDRPGTEGLGKALERIVADVGYRRALVSQGISVARRNHDGRLVRARFADTMRKLAAGGPS